MKALRMLRILGVFVCLLIIGCETERIETEYSNYLYEDAKVIDLVFSPAMHGEGKGSGITVKGDSVSVITKISIPEQYNTVFECQHGKFIISGKEIYSKFHVGDLVQIIYREEYKVTHQKQKASTGEKSWKPVQKELIKYDFIEARMQTQPAEAEFKSGG